MKLTVVMKIIGGFTIISLLFFLTSYISWHSLHTIDEATKRQNMLAIPLLKGSNGLANDLHGINHLTLRAYYQKDISKITKSQEIFQFEKITFKDHLTKLKNIAKNEQNLLANLNKLDAVYNDLEQNINVLITNKISSINHRSLLVDKITLLEEKADDIATLLLEIVDHDLVSKKLDNTEYSINNIKSMITDLVISSLEYKEDNILVSSELIASKIKSQFLDIENALNTAINILNQQKLTNIATSLNVKIDELKKIITGDENIFITKEKQLKAMTTATSSLLAAEKGITNVSDILLVQVNLADTTTIATGVLIKKSVLLGMKNAFVITFLSIVFAIIIAWVTLGSITRPLGRVNEMLHIVASGDLSRKLDESGSDEFAQLSRNCNLLIDNLKSLIQGIVSRSTQLTSAAEQTSTVTTQSTTAIDSQRVQLEQAATATTQMSNTSQGVLASANDALTEIKQADGEAERVKLISDRNRETIELLAHEVESAAQVINKLQQDSSSIGSILDVIRGIAEQTNLLALNAAIEAARAGEQGRGFAVVADEVRTLASRTQQSTQEIHSMIEVLQGGAEKAVTVMDKGKKQANDCVEQSVQAKAALDTITHAVHKAFDRSSQIATAAEEQSLVAHEISMNLESIVTIAEQTTNGSKQTAISSSEVARLAEELQQSVQKFKL